MKTYKMTLFQKFVLGSICKKIVIQSRHHRGNIIEYFKIMKEAAKEEFTEDNKPTLEGFLDECYRNAMGYSKK